MQGQNMSNLTWSIEHSVETTAPPAFSWMYMTREELGRSSGDLQTRWPVHEWIAWHHGNARTGVATLAAARRAASPYLYDGDRSGWGRPSLQVGVLRTS